MQRPRRRRNALHHPGALPLVLLTWLGLACAGGGGEPAPGEGYFPLIEGAQWTYKLQSELGSLELEVELLGEQELPGELPLAFVADERTPGPVLGFAEVSPVAYVIEDGYVARFQEIGYDGQGKLRALGQAEATRILPVDPRPGQKWGQQHSLFATPEGGGAELSWAAEVGELTTVSVPAGTFDDVVEVVIRYYEGSDPQPKIVYRDYYARGVGLVKSLTEDPGGNERNTVEQVLVAYKFPKAGS